MNAREINTNLKELQAKINSIAETLNVYILNGNKYRELLEAQTDTNNLVGFTFEERTEINKKLSFQLNDLENNYTYLKNNSFLCMQEKIEEIINSINSTNHPDNMDDYTENAKDKFVSISSCLTEIIDAGFEKYSSFVDLLEEISNDITIILNN